MCAYHHHIWLTHVLFLRGGLVEVCPPPLHSRIHLNHSLSLNESAWREYDPRSVHSYPWTRTWIHTRTHTLRTHTHIHTHTYMHTNIPDTFLLQEKKDWARGMLGWLQVFVPDSLFLSVSVCLYVYFCVFFSVSVAISAPVLISISISFSGLCPVLMCCLSLIFASM